MAREGARRALPPQSQLVTDAPGRPALFATTRQFLDDMGLSSLAQLPTLDGLPVSQALLPGLEEDESNAPQQEPAAPDVDAERDRLFLELNKTGELTDFQIIPGFHKVTSGKNGGGDPWHTDGSLFLGTIRSPAPPP